MFAKLRLAVLLAVTISLPAGAATTEGAHDHAPARTAPAHAAKPKAVKKAVYRPANRRWAAKANPNVRASHKKVVTHAPAKTKKKNAGHPGSASAPIVGTKV
jgi:hypothetical protein